MMNVKALGNYLTVSKVAWAFYFLLSFFVILFMNSKITDEPITGDATQNVRLGYYLYTEGVFAVLADDEGVPMPSNYREPVPPAINALFMYLHPEIKKTDSIESFKDGKNTKLIKQSNLFWLFLLQIGVGFVIYAVTRSMAWSFLGWFLVLFYFIRFGDHFDHLYTEIQAATMIVWTTYFLLIAVVNKKWIGYLLAGFSFGLLILTKAVFYYLTPVIILFLFLINREPKRVLHYGALFAATLLVVMPWLIRNQLLLNDFSITHRGGKVLYARAIMNNIESREATAAVYLWGPQLYKDIVSGTSLEVDTVEYAAGGRFEQLIRYPDSDSLAFEMRDPGAAVSYQSKMRIMTDSLIVELRNRGYSREEARPRAIDMLKEEGMEMILNNPVQHISKVPLFFWRGAWPFPNSTIPLVNDKLQVYINNMMNLAALLSLFFLPLWGLIRKQMKLIVIAILPAAMVLFHTLISHNIARYTESAIASMLICLTILLFYLYKRWVQDRVIKVFQK